MSERVEGAAVVAKLDQLNIVVRDMDAMAEFYGRLGVELQSGDDPEWAPHHRNSDGGDGIDLDLDSAPFAAVWNRGSTGPGIVLGFRLPDRESVDRLFGELVAAGYGGQQEPYDAFWGARYAVVTDPDGNAVGLMSTAEAHRRGAPPPAPPTG